MEPETITTTTTIIVSILTISGTLLGIWKSRKRGYDKRAEEMREKMRVQLEKSLEKSESNIKATMSDMNRRLEKNIGKLFDLAEYQLVADAEVRSDMKHLKSVVELKCG
jgi:F0F1-type ATP synthase membrane subunit b/b'